MKLELRPHAGGYGYDLLIDGVEIHPVKQVQLDVRPNNVAEACITLIPSTVDVHADHVRLKFACPICGDLVHEHTQRQHGGLGKLDEHHPVNAPSPHER